MVRKYLNNRQRILLHLSKYSSLIDDFIAPRALTQEGIGESIGIGRNNVPRELKKLIENNLVSVKKSHVNGVRNRRSVYFLTKEGISKANAIKDELRNVKVTIIDFSGNKRNLPLKDVPKNYGIDFITCTLNIEKDRTLDLVTLLRRREKAYHHIDENIILKNFYGRREEMEKLTKWVNSSKRILVMTGISGIGKTSLLLKFVKEKLKKRNVLFIKIENWKSVENVMYEIATFFSRIGMPKMEKYMRSVSASLEGEMRWNNLISLLKESLRDEILIFDSVENADDDIRELIRNIISLLPAKEFKVILSGTEIISLIPSSCLSYSEEMKIGELSEEESLAMLREMGVPDDRAAKLISKFGGNPLILQIAKNQSPQLLRNFIFENIVKILSPQEREALEFSSVFRKPFKMNAFLLNNFEYFTIYSLNNRNILLEMEYEKFTIHRMLRNFVYEHLTDEKRKEYHLMAARYYEEMNDVLEAVYHYTHGGKPLRANILLSENYERYIFEYGGEIRKLAMEILNSYTSVVDDHEWQLYGIIGDTYRIEGKWDEAIENYKKARSLVRNKDIDFHARVTLDMAYILGKRADYKMVNKVLNEIFKNINKIKDEKIIHHTYYILGILTMKTGALDEVEDYLREALKGAERAGDYRGMGYAYNGFGLFYGYHKGDWKKALENYKKAKEYFEISGDLYDLAKVLRNIGSAYYYLYDDKCEKYYKEAKRISEKIGDRYGVGESYLRMANYSMFKERYFDAKSYLEKSRDVFEELKAWEDLSYTYNSLGTFFAYLGDEKKGKENFDRAIELAAKIGNEKLIKEFSSEAMKYLKKYGYAYIENYEKIAKGKKKVVAIVNP